MRLFLLIIILMAYLAFFVEAYFIGNNNGCSDMIRISSASTIKLPEKYAPNFNRPWLNQKFQTRLFSSQILAQNWRWFKSHKIQGINSTFAEVLQILEKNDCFFVGYGSGVKNILLGKIKEQNLLKITGEISCDSLKLHEICSKNFGPDNCKVASNNPKIKIILGNDRTSKEFNETIIEPISFFSWNSMLTTDRLKWGFTVDESGLLDNNNNNQLGEVYFIDYTAQSQMDICENSIKIPVQPSYWKKWTNNNLLKILQVYNHVVNGFTIEEREYQFFIDFIKTDFNVENFQEYFCTFLYGGKFYPWFVKTNTTKQQIQNRSQCHFLTLDSRQIRFIQKVNQTLKEDFGNFWYQNMTLSLIGMSLFEDKGKPKNSVMKMITVNYQQNERYLKNGRTRIRNAFKEEMHASNEFASFQSTPKTEIPSIPANNTVQITLKVNCKENIVTIENQNFDGTKNTAPTQKSLNEEISIKRNYVLAEHVDDDPPIPQKTVKSNSRRGKYSLKSATPNPNIRYYTKDEVSHALATDY